MKRDPSLRNNSFPDASWTVSTVAISFTIFAVPAQGQAGPQVDLYGYVAPRCWVADPETFRPIADAPLPRVICNQATPMLKSQVRTLNADGTLAERVHSQQLPARAALEIVVSPQI
jgi:hypothetical protein